jgi:hypothetical protein
MWVLPTASVMGFLAAGATLSRVAVEADSPLWRLAFQGTAEGAEHGMIPAAQSRRLESPTSRLISSPPTRKNNVIRPSLTQCRRSLASVLSPTRTDRFVVHSTS